MAAIRLIILVFSFARFCFPYQLNLGVGLCRTRSPRLFVVESAQDPEKQIIQSSKSFDPKAAISYISSTTLQWLLVVGSMSFVSERVLPVLARISGGRFDPVSGTVTTIVLLLSLRSRVFSPLNNFRPKANIEDPVFKNRKRPSWQPPPKVFPIIWSTISVLRTAAALLVYKKTGSLVSPPLLAFYAHLSIGDTWNTINNVEGRLGTAFLGVLFVLASVLYTTYRYFIVLPLAGYIMAPTCLWLSIATMLVYSIWRLNYEGFNKPSLLPSREEGPPSKWKIPLIALAALL